MLFRSIPINTEHIQYYIKTSNSEYKLYEHYKGIESTGGFLNKTDYFIFESHNSDLSDFEDLKTDLKSSNVSIIIQILYDKNANNDSRININNIKQYMQQNKPKNTSILSSLFKTSSPSSVSTGGKQNRNKNKTQHKKFFNKKKRYTRHKKV